MQLREHTEEEMFELGVEGQAAAPGKGMNNELWRGCGLLRRRQSRSPAPGLPHVMLRERWDWVEKIGASSSVS